MENFKIEGRSGAFTKLLRCATSLGLLWKA